MKPESHLAELMAKAAADVKPVDINWNLPQETLVPGGALSQADYDKGLESLVTILHNQAAAGSLPTDVASPKGRWVDASSQGLWGMTGGNMTEMGYLAATYGLNSDNLPKGGSYFIPDGLQASDHYTGLAQQAMNTSNTRMDYKAFLASLPPMAVQNYEGQLAQTLVNAASDDRFAKFVPDGALSQAQAFLSNQQTFLVQGQAAQAYLNSFPSGGTDWTDINNIRNSWVGDTAFRTMGLARAGGGGLMAFGASTLDFTGFGAVIGVPAAAWALSQVGPGLSEFWNGPNGGHVQTVQTQAMIGLGVTPWKAEFADNLAGMALGFGAAVSPQWQPRIAPNMAEGLAGDAPNWMPRSLGAARHPVFDRLEGAMQRYGGQALENEGWVEFPSRGAARQAASEVAGDLGSSPKAIRLSDYDALDKQWWYDKSNKVIGRERLDLDGNSIKGWRDDYHGHTTLNSPPHVNVWTDSQKFHFFYRQGGVVFDANGLPVPR